MQDTWVQSLGWEVLEKGMANQSSILAWRIPWIEEPGGLQSMGSQSQTSLNDNTHTHRWADTCSWGGEAEGGWNTGSMVRVPGNKAPRVATSSNFSGEISAPGSWPLTEHEHQPHSAPALVERSYPGTQHSWETQVGKDAHVHLFGTGSCLALFLILVSYLQPHTPWNHWLLIVLVVPWP